MRITFLDLAQRYVSRRCKTRVTTALSGKPNALAECDDEERKGYCACLGVPRMGKDSTPVPAVTTRRGSRRLGVEYSVVSIWLMRFRHLVALHDPDGPWTPLVSGSLQYWPHGKCPQCGLNE
ncbi:hypothetical protein [Paraburkholderia strydomiana]|uniref:hypothetical protein n=1 Tax=Paraburkholderia strydomiana TaxID=1245417 RepID=UPI001BE9004A|nr:hypothetical protein [Paraburkholderia strydomiana]MBT2794833.1 hypothetical protein [Paraburkholderia strydomiana]